MSLIRWLSYNTFTDAYTPSTAGDAIHRNVQAKEDEVDRLGKGINQLMQEMRRNHSSIAAVRLGASAAAMRRQFIRVVLQRVALDEDSKELEDSR